VREFDLSCWTNYWHLLCHRSEVANSKDFVRLKAFDAEVVAFNDGKSVIVFDNHCPHRGARIFDAAFGREPFLCRYHGWSYSKGRIFIADADQFSHCKIKDAALNNYQSQWLGDFLFFAITPKCALEEQLGTIAPILESISKSIGSRHDFNSYEYESIWQISIENALEPYHISSVHPNSLAKLKLGPGENHFYGMNSAWFTTVCNEQSASRLKKLSRLFDFEFQHQGYMNVFLFPFSMLSSTFGLSYSLQNFFPSIQIERTNFSSRLYASKLRNGMNSNVIVPFMDSTAALNRQVFDEDRNICERIPRSCWSEEKPLYFAAHDEQRLVHFRRTVKAER
jgi:phenylpropionate dioxygenase-like ring-hydroxylating dioxygenase large terminal subunit